MAVEFRDRAWGKDTEAIAWMREHDVVLVAADELWHETVSRGDKAATDADAEAGFVRISEDASHPQRKVMPVLTQLTSTRAWYIRLHRRAGRRRLLSAAEIRRWVARIEHITSCALDGPVYFMIGTDWEDAPVINARALEGAMRECKAGASADLVLNWRALLAARRPGALHRFFAGASGDRSCLSAGDGDCNGVGDGVGDDDSEGDCSDGNVRGKCRGADSHYSKISRGNDNSATPNAGSVVDVCGTKTIQASGGGIRCFFGRPRCNDTTSVTASSGTVATGAAVATDTAMTSSWCAEDAVLRDAGLSVDVFYALPAEVRREVMAQYTSRGATEAGAAAPPGASAQASAQVRAKDGRKRARAANTMHKFFTSKQQKA